MVFQGEDVTLTEDVLRIPPPKFIQTRSESAADEHLQIIESKNQTLGLNAVVTIFEVPKGKTFYLTNSSLQMARVAVAGGTSFLRMRVLGNKFIHIFRNITTIDTNIFESRTYPMPIKMEEGQLIEVQTNIATDFAAVIIGWEESRKVS